MLYFAKSPHNFPSHKSFLTSCPDKLLPTVVSPFLYSNHLICFECRKVSQKGFTGFDENSRSSLSS